MADPAAAEEEVSTKKALSKAEERIKEMDRRNKELEKLVNMKNRLEGVESTVAEVVARQGQQKTEEAPDPQNWSGFLGPKVNPIIEKVVAPLRQALFHVADRNDRLDTMLKHDIYRTDPELQDEVEQIRASRYKQTGNLEPRDNIITYMKGHSDYKDRFEKKEFAKEREEEATAAITETSQGEGAPRAAKQERGLTKDSSVEEMEKWFREHPEDSRIP